MALTDSLQGYWTMDEASGTRADSTANNNDLTENGTGGVGSATGIINLGADFERSEGDYLSIADASQTGLDITGDMSISCWYKTESNAFNNALAQKSGTSGNYSWWIKIRATDILFVVSANGSTLTDASISFTSSVGTLYHFVLTYDASAGTCEVFIDDVSKGTDATLATSIYNGTGPFEIGQAEATSDQMDGIIDEFGIWSRVLSGAEITELYNGGAGLPFSDFSGGADTHFLSLLGIGK